MNQEPVSICHTIRGSSDKKYLGIGLTEKFSMVMKKKSNKTDPRENDHKFLRGVLRSRLRVRSHRHHYPASSLLGMCGIRLSSESLDLKFFPSLVQFLFSFPFPMECSTTQQHHFQRPFVVGRLSDGMIDAYKPLVMKLDKCQIYHFVIDSVKFYLIFP